MQDLLACHNRALENRCRAHAAPTVRFCALNRLALRVSGRSSVSSARSAHRKLHLCGDDAPLTEDWWRHEGFFLILDSAVPVKGLPSPREAGSGFVTQRGKTRASSLQVFLNAPMVQLEHSSDIPRLQRA
ncbi:hypothetical protein GN956_G10999 [Arapaima gigas]